MEMSMDNRPRVGSQIYVPSALYLSHGRDDFRGGQATVSSVQMQMSGGEMVPFVSIVERPGHSYNWEFLRKEQPRLKALHGEERAQPDPDMHPDANDW